MAAAASGTPFPGVLFFGDVFCGANRPRMSNEVHPSDTDASARLGIAEAKTGLASCAMLEDLPPEVMARLERACRWLRLPPDSIVFRHEDPVDAVYFLISGTVRVFVSTKGRQVNYAELGPGQVFGELAVIDGLPRSADVMTVTEAVLAACPSQTFIDALKRHPQMAFGMIKKLVAMIRQADDKINRFSAMSGVQRVYLELLRLTTPDISGDGTWVISPVPLHKEMAAWAGTTPDVVGRALGHLMRANLVQRRGGALQVLDRKRIEMLVESPSDDVL
ncbi:CRP/FNR family transcriptional regulator, cyclic AMP receptor protein [uncultured Gammaproteobacteria bacterium]